MARFDPGSRVLGVAAAICAVALGLVYMALAGAPLRLLLINSAALGIGLVLVILVTILSPAAARLRGPLLILLALLLLATALGGISVEGATRWVAIGGLSVQPGLVLAPVLVTAYASRTDGWSTAALVIAVIAIAMQPDRAVAAMILAGVTVVALHRPDRIQLALWAIAVVGFTATLMRPDRLPATPYVDQILYTSFDAHPLAGVAVWAGTFILLAPLLPQIVRREYRHPAVWAFAAVWGVAVLAAALGNYPTPLVGYGGSAIIGYLLSLAPLAGTETARTGSPAEITAKTGRGSGTRLRFA